MSLTNPVGVEPFFFCNEFLKLLATWLGTWVKTLYINKKFSTQYFYYENSFNWVEKCIIQFWMTKIVAIKAKNSQHCSLLLARKKKVHCIHKPDAVAIDLTILNYSKKVCSLKLNYTFPINLSLSKNVSKEQFFFLMENMQSYHFYQTWPRRILRWFPGFALRISYCA